MSVLDVVGRERALAVVRAETIDDPPSLVAALLAGGISTIEFTFTTPGVTKVIAAAAGSGATIGAGTVLTADQARSAIDAGAEFLVSPGVSLAAIEVSAAAGVPFVSGALTPSEVMAVLAAGCQVVKIFPASTVGPDYFGQLLGPFPGLKALASGGISEHNAADFIRAGAWAVAAGSSVVSQRLIQDRDWAGITERARLFVAALAS